MTTVNKKLKWYGHAHKCKQSFHKKGTILGKRRDKEKQQSDNATGGNWKMIHIDSEISMQLRDIEGAGQVFNWAGIL